MMRRYVLALLIGLAPVLTLAGGAQPMIDDPVLESRVMDLSAELRCLVCQGQSLAESHADFATDMRDKMLGLMRDGMTDEQVVEYLVARYGDFIRFRPPLKATTLLLWLGPLLLFVIAASLLAVTFRRRKQRAAAVPLSDTERRRLETLLRDEAEDGKA